MTTSQHTHAKDAALLDERMNLPTLASLMQDLDTLRQNPQEPLHLVCYDIDSLRKINFSYGHAVGDELLQQVADWVRQFSQSTLYRIEGDMFCLLVRGRTLEQVQQFAGSAMYRSKGPWPVHACDGLTEIFVTARMGIVPVDDYVLSQNLSDLMERLLDDARRARDIVVFNRETDEIMQEYIRLQMDLKTCIMRGMAGFGLVFQPIADPATGLWVGLEALCRWQRANGTQVPPLIFIPEVEKLGLMRPFGMWVLEEAVSTCKSLGLDRLDRFFLSVNVSASQLQPEFAAQVRHLLARQGYPPQKLNLEITESTEFIFNDATHALLDTLRALGITFALDDFGTGYSSFSNMKQLPVRYIKTEREFIYGIEGDNYLQYSLYVIAESAHASGMRMIVEGVETRDTLRCVAKNGADLVQGYYYSEPLEKAVLQQRLGHFIQPGFGTEGPGCDSRFNFGKWLHSKDAYSIAPGLFELLGQCLDRLLNEDDLDRAVNDILRVVGTYCRADRAYVFLRDGGTVFSNRYEWCAPGVASQMALFQQVDTAGDGFYQTLCEEPFLITNGEDRLPANMRRLLAKAGQQQPVQALAVQPMHRKGQILGFVGFDDNQQREWLPEEMLLLHNLCLLVLIKLNMWGTNE